MRTRGRWIRFTWNVVRSYVYDDCTWLDPITLYKFGFTNCGDEDISFANLKLTSQ